MEELDYALVPKAAWELLHGWCGLSQGSKPIERFTVPFVDICTTFVVSFYRYVVEYGTIVKHVKVEVYLVEFKLCVHPHLNKIKIDFFSRACTISETISLCV